jgi:hypothetical protein
MLGLGLRLMFLVLSLKVGLQLKATRAMSSRHPRDSWTIQTSLSCANSSRCSISGTVGDSNDTEIETMQLLQTSSGVVCMSSDLKSQCKATKTAVLAVSFAM